MPRNKDMIAGGRLNINRLRYFEVSTLASPGEISTTPNQPDAKLMERSDKLFSRVDCETDLILRFYTDKGILSKSVASLQIPERLLGLLPLSVFLPRVVQKLKRRFRGEARMSADKLLFLRDITALGIDDNGYCKSYYSESQDAVIVELVKKFTDTHLTSSFIFNNTKDK